VLGEAAANRDMMLQQHYETALNQFVGVEMGYPVFVPAAQLGAHFALKTPNALHLACAQHYDCAEL
jgi:hypothetical protein